VCERRLHVHDHCSRFLPDLTDSSVLPLELFHLVPAKRRASPPHVLVGGQFRLRDPVVIKRGVYDEHRTLLVRGNLFDQGGHVRNPSFVIRVHRPDAGVSCGAPLQQLL